MVCRAGGGSLRLIFMGLWLGGDGNRCFGHAAHDRSRLLRYSSCGAWPGGNWPRQPCLLSRHAGFYGADAAQSDPPAFRNYLGWRYRGLLRWPRDGTTPARASGESEKNGRRRNFRSYRFDGRWRRCRIRVFSSAGPVLDLDFSGDRNRRPDRRPRRIGFETKRGRKGFFFNYSGSRRHTGPPGQPVLRGSDFLLVLHCMKRLAIVGSTGSIGQNTLRVVEHLSDRFQVFALAANSAAGLLAEQAARFHPKVVAISNGAHVEDFRSQCKALGIAIPEIVTGEAGLRQIAGAGEVDIVVSAAVGAAGIHPTYSAVAAGKTVALANKEAMVIAGELLRKAASKSGAQIIPVDSEHSAVDQCLRSGRRGEVRRLILTASGGPFRDTPAEKFPSITPEEALKHPTWQMGKRITIDSATLMNKGLEVIEARWLFDIPPEKIDIIVHPQSVMHSMVEFVDGSVVGQLGTADMRTPIQYALTFPERLSSPVPPLDWNLVSRLDFMQPARKKFPCISLAYRAIEVGGTAPAVLNAADEVAVEAFLNRKIPFSDIPKLIAGTLEAHKPNKAERLETIIEADAWARKYALKWLS